MKSKKLILICILLITCTFLFGQTNERTKEESDRNKRERQQKRDNGGHNNSSSDGGSELANGCIEGCASGCMDQGCMALWGLAGEIIEGLVRANENIKAREMEVPRIKSVELGFNAGYINPGSSLVLPSLRLRGGLLSTSFRVFSNTEQHIDGKSNYTTLNWQALQFNLAVEKYVNIALGTGFMLETYSGLVFNEFSFGMEFFPATKFYLPFEFRLTPDYVTGKMVLFEMQTGFGFNIKEWQHSALRLQANYTYGKYYEAVNVHAFSLGITFLIDTGKSAARKPE